MWSRLRDGVDPQSRASVASAGSPDERARYWRRQVIEAANSVDFFANIQDGCGGPGCGTVADMQVSPVGSAVPSSAADPGQLADPSVLPEGDRHRADCVAPDRTSALRLPHYTATGIVRE